MKYNSLREGSSKIFKVNKFDGGINKALSPLSISDNQLSDCKNVWYNSGCLQTRPGINCEGSNVIHTPSSGNSDFNKYKLHNEGVYIDGDYMRIATMEECIDDSVYYCNVYLVGENNKYISIGNLSFFRTTSEIFYTPLNILFYTGKAQTGGGIFAMVTLKNDYNPDEKYYNFYEINEDLNEWNKVYNFYIPTLYINGRGNKYAIAKSSNGINTEAPLKLESPNMLNGRFHSYFTSDGYSNSFRLPFVNLSSDTIVCRIYYTLVDYVEWQVAGNTIADKKNFFGGEVTMQVDREKGTVYFIADGKDYAIPVMDMYHENNIKITATKEIERGIEKVIHSTCVLSYGSSIIVSGGENGNEIFETDYNTPLYFPQNSSLEVGLSDSEIIDLRIKDGKIIALKQDEIYSLTYKKGKKINEISLLADNDKCFKEADSFTCDIITGQIGCCDKNLTAVLNDNIIFLGSDKNIYLMTSLNAESIVCISNVLGEDFESFKYADFALSGKNRYIIFKNNKAFVAEIKEKNNFTWYYWEFPQSFKINGGLFSKDEYRFICSSLDLTITFLATLNSDDGDKYYEFDKRGYLVKSTLPIDSNLTTKYFDFSSFSSKKSIENIYLALASRESISISVNGREIADINLRLTNEEYDKGDYKSVKLRPYIKNTNSVYVTLASKSGMSIGELEIIYR